MFHCPNWVIQRLDKRIPADCRIFRLLDYFEYSGGAVNLTAIRTVRVLRPLRAINRIPSINLMSKVQMHNIKF